MPSLPTNRLSNPGFGWIIIAVGSPKVAADRSPRVKLDGPVGYPRKEEPEIDRYPLISPSLYLNVALVTRGRNTVLAPPAATKNKYAQVLRISPPKLPGIHSMTEAAWLAIFLSSKNPMGSPPFHLAYP